MNFGALAGGISEGLGNGVNIATQLAALREADRLRKARAAVGAMYSQGGGGGGIVSPGQLPPGGGPQDPGMSVPAMNGGAQPPMPGAPSLPSGGAPPMPGMGPQPMPPAEPDPMMGPMNSPMATPPGPPGGDGSLQGPAMGATGAPLTGAAATSGNVVQDAQGTIASIAQQIKAANPNIDPETLFNATSQQIEQMKGVRNDVKDYMQMQVELAKQQVRMQIAEQRIQGNLDVANVNAGSRERVAGTRADASRDVASTQAGARLGSARIGADSRRDVASTNAGARVDSANIGADSRRDVADTGADARAYGADQAYRGRVSAASTLAGAGPTPKPGPGLGARRNRKPAKSAGPPVPGARKAPDGNWYVPDPNPQRAGKYLKVG